MPSSHSSLVTGLATATGRVAGVGSVTFAITVVLASIVMYDAAGVRRAVSIQARILNQMIDEAFQGKPFAEKRLRELIGHTPIQVFVGGLLGIGGRIACDHLAGFISSLSLKKSHFIPQKTMY